MPRLARNVLEGKQLIHVMVQGINKEKIFLEEREKYEYIKLLNKNKKEYDIDIISYCVMDNHVHILINTESTIKLTRFMHKVNTAYGIYFNKNKGRVGYVYRDRYKTQVINNERHLYNCILYIHNNPVKAHICKNASEYRFSSYKKFLYKENEDALRKIFGNKEIYIIANKIENIEDMSFIEDEEDNDINIKSFIENYINKNKTNYAEISIDNNKLKIIANELKKTFNISNLKISRYLGVSKYKIEKLIDNKK